MSFGSSESYKIFSRLWRLRGRAWSHVYTINISWELNTLCTKSRERGIATSVSSTLLFINYSQKNFYHYGIIRLTVLVVMNFQSTVVAIISDSMLYDLLLSITTENIFICTTWCKWAYPIPPPLPPSWWRFFYYSMLYTYRPKKIANTILEQYAKCTVTMTFKQNHAKYPWVATTSGRLSQSDHDDSLWLFTTNFNTLIIHLIRYTIYKTTPQIYSFSTWPQMQLWLLFKWY